jgi:hypothetical protein
MARTAIPMRIHRFSELFPPVVGKAYTKLARDLRRDGKVPPVTLFEGALLDGRARLHIAETHKLQCNTVDYEGNDPIGFLIKQNLPRCWSLPMSQRAMIAAKAMTLIEDLTTRFDLIADLRVPPSMLAGARRILASATQREIKDVSEGRTSISVLQAKVRARSPMPPGPKPKPRPDGLPAVAPHISTLRERAKLWRHLRDGLDLLLDLPPPPDVAAAMLKIPNIGLDGRLEKACTWLENFSDEWRKQNNG